MTLNKFIQQLQKLAAEGNGDLQVFYRHGASGDCGELSDAYIDDEINDCGPFDLPEGSSYVTVYAGN